MTTFFMWSGMTFWAVILLAIILPTRIFHLSVKAWFFNKSLGPKPAVQVRFITTEENPND